MTFPWEQSASRLELIKDPITGLYPGERDGIPGFLRRVRMPDGTVQIGLSPSNNPQDSSQS
jgi:hypothetical protein